MSGEFRWSTRVRGHGGYIMVAGPVVRRDLLVLSDGEKCVVNTTPVRQPSTPVSPLLSTFWSNKFGYYAARRCNPHVKARYYCAVMPQGSWLGPLSFLVLIDDLSTGCSVVK